MKSFLEFMQEYYRSYISGRGMVLDLLASRGPEQDIIQRWCKEARPPKRCNFASIQTYHYLNLEDVSPCEEWEARLIILSHWFGCFVELSEWEESPTDYRIKHTQRVARLARELANALEETPRPYYPTALGLFDEENAANIIKSLAGGSAEALLGYRSASSALAGRFSYPQPQRFPSMLRRLADAADEGAKETKRDKRPNLGHPNARAFARYLAEYFYGTYGRTPNNVIAACVFLKYPDIDPPPDEFTIRSWRNAR